MQYLQYLNMDARSGLPDRACAVRHKTDELQNSMPFLMDRPLLLVRGRASTGKGQVAAPISGNGAFYLKLKMLWP
jgi:hypothetical protein